MQNRDPIEVQILLENGSTFRSRAFGDFNRPRFGELVFCTSMTGIQESLTDPSFACQIIVSTVAHVGNTGINDEDSESRKIWAEGLICRKLENRPSSWRATKSLSDWVLENDRFLVFDVDTRLLTHVLREEGSQRCLVFDPLKQTGDEAQKFLEDVPPMAGQRLCDVVSCKESYRYKSTEAYWPLGQDILRGKPRFQKEAPTKKIAVWDFGVKNNTLRLLDFLGADVQVFPSKTGAEDFKSFKPDAILLSNGPGDPSASSTIVSELKKMIGQQPIFAICLGHQLLAQALGAKTYKMKFGHRGIHHPVVELNSRGESIRTWITSQNHGFAVDAQNMPSDLELSFVHADDESVEGIRSKEKMCESVQFHPEVAPGPHDSSVLLKRFYGELLKS